MVVQEADDRGPDQPVSSEAVLRSQMKSILQKTNTDRQTSLVRISPSDVLTARSHDSIETVRRISWFLNPIIDGRAIPGRASTS